MLFFERNNQIGGYAYYCQIDDRRKDEVLLLQIPSNSNLGINFYDNGICHFFIKKEDLEQLNFDNVRLVIDSE